MFANWLYYSWMTYSSTFLSKKKLVLTKGNTVSFGISLGGRWMSKSLPLLWFNLPTCPWHLNYTYFFSLSLSIFLNWNRIDIALCKAGASLVVQIVKNLPAVQETQDRSLGRADPLESGMETHSSILTWRIPWAEEPGGLRSMGLQSQAWLSGWAHLHTLCKG